MQNTYQIPVKGGFKVLEVGRRVTISVENLPQVAAKKHSDTVELLKTYANQRPIYFTGLDPERGYVFQIKTLSRTKPHHCVVLTLTEVSAAVVQSAA